MRTCGTAVASVAPAPRASAPAAATTASAAAAPPARVAASAADAARLPAHEVISIEKLLRVMPAASMPGPLSAMLGVEPPAALPRPASCWLCPARRLLGGRGIPPAVVGARVPARCAGLSHATLGRGLPSQARSQSARPRSSVASFTGGRRSRSTRFPSGCRMAREVCGLVSRAFADLLRFVLFSPLPSLWRAA